MEEMVGRLGRLLRLSGARTRGSGAGDGGGEGRRPIGAGVLLALTVALVLVAALGVGAARAWHANDVTVEATCDSESSTYQITATIQQSQDWPGAVVLSITPSSFPGTTSGDQAVVVKIGWPDSTETQTFTKTVSLKGDCGGPPKGTLVVVKKVVNDDGGTATAGQWTMHVSGPASLSFPGDEGGVSNSVPAGSYSVSESGGPGGYTLSYSGACDADGHVTVTAGHSATCVLTNDDVAHETPKGTLVVVKKVVNDDGGTATAGQWTMHVSGPASLSFAGDEGGVSNSVPAGSYSVSESSGPGGYTLSYSGACDSGGKVTVQAEHTSTCVLTNNDTSRQQGQGSIRVSKSANPTTLQEPGGQVVYSVTITNTSSVRVTIDNVVDDVFGDLDDEGGSGCFDVPINLAPGKKANCTFQETIIGAGGTTHTNVVTVTGHDEFGHHLQASDTARVAITARQIDLVLVKDATSPTPLNGTVNYALAVTNKGPDSATNVQLADPAPQGITYLSATASQGSCTVTPSLVSCNLGTIAPGQTVTVAVTARATSVGSFTNTATVTGSGGRETNPADNVDTAVTVVPAPTKPPTPKPPVPAPKPKPKSVPQVCLALTVSPKMITADGKPDRVVVTVSAGGKRVRGIKVLLKGAGIDASARTKGKGVAVLKINTSRVGLIRVSIAHSNVKLCGQGRIGVVGVFLPPVTG